MHTDTKDIHLNQFSRGYYGAFEKEELDPGKETYQSYMMRSLLRYLTKLEARVTELETPEF